MSNQHILPADYWTQHVYNITPGKEIKCFGHKIKDKKVMDNLLRQALKNIESKSGSISGVQLTTPVKPSDLTNETNVMERKAMDSAEQQAKNDTKKALLEIQKANTTAIKSNTMQGLPAKPTSATPIQVMDTPSDGSEAKAPTVGEAVDSVQKAVGNQVKQAADKVQKAVGDAVKAAGDALNDTREKAAKAVIDAAKAISPKPVTETTLATETTPADMTTTQATSTMSGGRRRTKRRKRRRKHKTKHKRKKKRTTRKRKKRTRRRKR